MKKLIALLLTLVLLAGVASGALAEDVFVIRSVSDAADNADSESYVDSSLTTGRSYLRVDCRLEDEMPVLLSIADSSGCPVYQRDYGLCSGNFRSEDIFLRLDGSPTTYEVTFQAGEDVYAFPIRRVMPRVSGATACSAGYPLAEISGLNTWQTATLLDLAALDGGSLTVPICASDAYEVGEVTFMVNDGELVVSASLNRDVDGSIDEAKVYAATTALEAGDLGRKTFSGVKGKLDRAINLTGADYAAVYVQLTLSYSPADLPATPDMELDGQADVWQRMQNETVNEAVG